MQPPRFQSFKVVHLTKDEDFLIEIAYGYGHELLIVSDLRCKDNSETFHQKAYGFVKHFTDADIETFSKQLKDQHYARRREVGFSK